MEIIRGIENLLPPPRRPVVTLGNFDGVHLGHQKIFQEVTRQAKEAGLPSIILTFDPHPAKVLNPGEPLPLIMPLKRRLEVIASFGIDLAVIIKFTPEFSRLTAREFVAGVLWEKVQPRLVLVGYNFNFGKGREGTPQLLKSLGEELGFEVEIVEPVCLGKLMVSSSEVRRAVEAGEVDRANDMLGRPFQLTGPVIKGKGLGKGLGFPTANIAWDNELIPKEGVYACLVEYRGATYKGVVNIGTAPTVKGDELSVEVHLLNFKGEIYREELKLSFIKRLRDEGRFESIAALREQIKRDIERAEEIL